MSYYHALFMALASLGVLYLSFTLFKSFRYILLKKRICKMQLDQKSLTYLEKIPYYRTLNDEEKAAIHRSILLFIHTKTFIGVKITITQEIKVVVAFHACFLLLKHPELGCYKALKHIVIYAHNILKEEIKSQGGIYTKARFILEGQSTNDTVVLSWHEIKKEAYTLRHSNVAFHEFAHEIDFMEGQIDGIAPIELSKYHQWITTMSKTFMKLNKKSLQNRNWGKYKLIGSYAASNEAEFFAVLTERFFESPKQFKKDFADIYELFKDFYRIDPLERLAV